MAPPLDHVRLNATHAGKGNTMKCLYSYVVAYDSGFAPNPFSGFCTLATCKPEIRKHASIGDWIVGTGSNKKGICRGGFLVYAMRVQEALTFTEYWHDPRFQKKKPNLYGSYQMACGDNIYSPDQVNGGWCQLNSHHTNYDGSPNHQHIARDTAVDRVLISSDFIYFGSEGPAIPSELKAADLVISGRSYRKISNTETIAAFEVWIKSLGVSKYQGRPFDMP